MYEIRENKFKKILLTTTYLLLTVVCIIGIYILITVTSNKENDSIVVAQSSTNFRNVNPKFLIDFVNDEYVRFETVSSYSNPFTNEKQSIWEKIKYILGVAEERKGVQISLIEVSYDTELSNRIEDEGINISAQSLNKSFELTSLGREIGVESDEAVSKDTVISRNIYQGVDLEYQIIKGQGLKEEIVLNELPQYTTECSSAECILPVNRFLFKLELDEGLTLQRSLDSSSRYPSGTFYITDTQGNYYAHFLPEFAVDSVGYKTSNVVSNIIQTDSNEYTYEVILDSEWLLDTQRVFPIRIDPSIIHDGELVFNLGIYDRVALDNIFTIRLDSAEYKSGTYTSSIIDLGENNLLNSISWKGFAQATGNGEIPFSTMGLLYEDNFNELESFKKKWGTGALQLDVQESKTFGINSNPSEYLTVEFWSYKRNINNEEKILTSNLGNLNVKDGKYIFEDVLGIQYETDIPIKYNRWQYISLIFSISNQRVTLYVDEVEYIKETTYSDQTQLKSLTFAGIGYIDTLRIYERLLAKNELLSNTQYSNIYLQYMTSTDDKVWSTWSNKAEYIPTPVLGAQYMDISSVGENIGNYDILSFEFLTDLKGSMTLGTSKFSNGVDEEDITRLTSQQDIFSEQQQLRYIDLVFTPKVVQNACILSLEGLEIYTLDTGKVGMKLGELDITLDDMYVLNEENRIALSLLDEKSHIYMNGHVLEESVPYVLIPTKYGIGGGCSNQLQEFDGEIADVRVSVNQKEEGEILKYMDILSRTYALKPMFKAKLQNAQQILDITDTQFSISEMEYGAPNHISNLNIGDKIVVIEGDEYTLNGEVVALEPDTGFVEVRKWAEGSTVPQGGFTLGALLLKWQTEYISTKAFLDIQGVVTYINMKYEGVKDIKNVTLFSALNADDTMSFTPSSDRYLKYRFIYMTSIYGVSPYLSSVNIEYENSGPGMEQLMRHGKWFNEGTQQTFWWSK